MSKIKIAFDLDGCLIDLMSPIKRLLKEIHGFDLYDEHPRYKQFDLSVTTGIPRKELWKLYRMVYKEIKATPIYPGATELLAKLYEKTNEPPLILTARPFDTANDAYAIVEKLVKKTPFTLVLKHPRIDKADHLHGYYYYLEDRRKNAKDLANRNFVVPLIHKPYNDIPDIDKWRNILYIEGVEQLLDHVDTLIERGTYFDIRSFKKSA